MCSCGIIAVLPVKLFYFYFCWMELPVKLLMNWVAGALYIRKLGKWFWRQNYETWAFWFLRSLNDLEFTQKTNNNNWNFCGFLLFKWHRRLTHWPVSAEAGRRHELVYGKEIFRQPKRESCIGNCICQMIFYVIRHNSMQVII